MQPCGTRLHNHCKASVALNPTRKSRNFLIVVSAFKVDHGCDRRDCGRRNDRQPSQSHRRLRRPRLASRVQVVCLPPLSLHPSHPVTLATAPVIIESTHVLTPRSEGRRASRIRFSRQASHDQPTRPIVHIVDTRAGHGRSPPSSVVSVIPSPSSTRPARQHRRFTRVARGARARVR